MSGDGSNEVRHNETRPEGGPAGKGRTEVWKGGTGGMNPMLRLPPGARPYGEEADEEAEEIPVDDQLLQKMLPVTHRVIDIPLRMSIADALIFVGWLAAKRGSEGTTVPYEVMQAVNAAAEEALGYYNPPPPAEEVTEPPELTEPPVTNA